MLIYLSTHRQERVKRSTGGKVVVVATKLNLVYSFREIDIDNQQSIIYKGL